MISTGKSDWPHDVTSESGSLASYLNAAMSSAPKSQPAPNVSSTVPAVPSDKTVPGIYDTRQVSKVTILNGSHYTICDDPNRDTVLVLPDYKVVSEVERSAEGAEQLWKDAVDPAVGRAGAPVEGSKVRSWVIPYSVVILLCMFGCSRLAHSWSPAYRVLFTTGSHKKRDNRCAIAAPKLELGKSSLLL